MVRQLTVDDVPLYRELRLYGLRKYPTAFLSDWESDEKVPLASLEERFRKHNPYNIVFGAFEGDTLVGMVGVYREHDRLKKHHKTVIWGMIVHHDHQKKGWARKLLGKAISHSRGLADITRVELGVEASNSAALALYESLGFKVWGREPEAMIVDGKSCDECYMSLKL